MGLIYILTSPSGKIYIGQTIYTLESRWRDHIYDAFDPNKNHCKALNNAIKKYGRNNFKKDVLLYCNNDLLDYFEEKAIDIYVSYNVDYGYNIKRGGSSGKHSEETKRKISQTRKHNNIIPCNRKHTRIWNSNNTYKFISAKDASEFIGCNRASVCDVARGDYKTIYGWQVEYIKVGG